MHRKLCIRVECVQLNEDEQELLLVYMSDKKNKSREKDVYIQSFHRESFYDKKSKTLVSL